MPTVYLPYPRIDAIADLYVKVLAEDCRCAIAGDMCHCAIAMAIKRALGHDADSDTVFVMPTTLYVLMETNKATARALFNRDRHVKPGDLALHRYRVDGEAHAKIVKFDAGEYFGVGPALTLRTWKGCGTLKRKRDREKAYMGAHGPSRKDRTMEWRRGHLHIRKAA